MIARFFIILLTTMTTFAQADEIYDCMGRHLFSNNSASAFVAIPAVDRVQDKIIELAITSIVDGEFYVAEYNFKVEKNAYSELILIAETELDFLGVRRALFFDKSSQKISIFKFLYDTLSMQVISGQTYTFDCAMRK